MPTNLPPVLSLLRPMLDFVCSMGNSLSDNQNNSPLGPTVTSSETSIWRPISIVVGIVCLTLCVDSIMNCRINRSRLSVFSTRSGGDSNRIPSKTPKARLEKIGALPEDVPEVYCCPLSREIMTDPVFFSGDGKTYERAYINEWLKNNPNLTPDKKEISGKIEVLLKNQGMRINIENYLTGLEEEARLKSSSSPTLSRHVEEKNS